VAGAFRISARRFDCRFEGVCHGAAAIHFEHLARLAHGVLAEARVVEVTAELIGGEFGFLDCLAGLTLKYDRAEAGAPASLVMKASSSEAIYRRIGDFYGAYEREFKFYESVAVRSPIRLARCWAREFVASSSTHYLFLEDLRHLTPGDQVAGMTLEQARACIETIGRFHAAWWQTVELEALSWMPMRNIRTERFRAVWPKFKEVVGPSLSAAQIALGEQLNAGFDELLDEIERHPSTIVHSDFRADNLLFDPSSATDPVVVLDSQLAIRGNPLLDVARLLCGSLQSEDRAAAEFELLRRWHEVLVAGGVRDYSFRDALEAYRQAVLMCLYYPVTIHEAEEAAGRRGTALAQAQISRMFAAAEWASGFAR
jgi:thiamine kinase-like enzyme